MTRERHEPCKKLIVLPVHLFAVVWDAKHVQFELVFLVEIDVVNLEAHFPGTSALAITEETSSIMPRVRPAMNPCHSPR